MDVEAEGVDLLEYSYRATITMMIQMTSSGSWKCFGLDKIGRVWRVGGHNIPNTRCKITLHFCELFNSSEDAGSMFPRNVHMAPRSRSTVTAMTLWESQMSLGKIIFVINIWADPANSCIKTRFSLLCAICPVFLGVLSGALPSDFPTKILFIFI